MKLRTLRKTFALFAVRKSAFSKQTQNYSRHSRVGGNP